MKTAGYMGRILRIDLSSGGSRVEEMDDDVARKFIGGCGLGAMMLYRETDVDTDPLGPENRLILATGPVTGTRMYSSDRFDAVSRSPLTGIFAESNAGGYWGSTFKRCGFDALVLQGKAEQPVYLYIENDHVEIRDAAHLWGHDTFQTTEQLRTEHGRGTRAAVIGPAGERLVKISNIVTDGRHGRVLGRCGLGAVMGSKNLKAIAVNGDQSIKIADSDRLTQLLKKFARSMREDTAVLKEGGTSVGLDFCESIGNLPIRNWYQGSWPDGAKKLTGLTMAKERLVDRYHCGRCPIGCGRVVNALDGPYAGRRLAGPEYETLAMLGSNCMIDDLNTVVKANELCNRYGIDTISTGAAAAFAIEAYQRGLIGRQDTGGLEVEWGNGQALLSLIDKIASKQDIGELLAEGVRSAAARIGGLAAEFAIEVKGLEPPAHDPRARVAMGLGFATSNRGACHLSSFTMDFEEGATIDDLGAPALPDRFNTENKGENVFRMQNLMSMFDSLVCCKFVLFGGITVNPLIEFLNAITGWDMDHGEFSATGDRIFNMKRLFNIRAGVSRKDDVLPTRLLTHRRGGGTDALPVLNVMLSDYYRYRGWNEFGIPTRKRLEELELIPYIPKNGIVDKGLGEAWEQ